MRYGLEYGGELVAVMTFSKSRYNKNVVWELVRFANKLDTIVIGGFSKLLAYFRKFNSCSIVSYCDKSRGFGSVYINQRFILQNMKVTPSFAWTDNYKVYNRLQLPEVQ